ASGGRYAGLCVGGGGSCRVDSGSGGSEVSPATTQVAVPSIESRVCRLGLQPLRTASLDEADVWLAAADRAATRGREGVCDSAKALDRRADILVADHEPTLQQRLRTPARDDRSLHLHTNDTTHVSTTPHPSFLNLKTAS